MVDDLYRWDGSDSNPNQPRPGQPGPGGPGPGGGDLYRWDGGDGRPMPQPYQPQPNPWQQQWQQEQQQIGMRPRQFWGGRGQGGGDIYVTAMPGSEVIINNAGDTNLRGGMNYDYRYPGGNQYDYQQYMPRQYYQPSYQQYQSRGCFCPPGTQPVYAPDYYQGGYQGPQVTYRNDSVSGGRGGYSSDRTVYNQGGYTGYPGTPPFVPPQNDGWNTAGNMMDMALRGFDAWAGYDVAKRYSKQQHGGHHGGRPGRFYPEEALAYGHPRGNMQHGWQRYPNIYQRG